VRLAQKKAKPAAGDLRQRVRDMREKQAARRKPPLRKPGKNGQPPNGSPDAP
jgi:hypothetical protein